jgi:hypothetical protein
MLVMAVLLLAGTSFMTISSTENQIALNERASAQAQLLAEAAIQKAIARLNVAPTYSGETDTPLGGGTFKITATMVPGCTPTSARALVATAKVPVNGGTATAEIRATADKVSYPFRWAVYSTLPNGILEYDDFVDVDRTDKEVWIYSSGVVDSFDSGGGVYDPSANSGSRGNIGSNGDVAVDFNSEIKGDIRAGDNIFMPDSVTVTGTQTENAPALSFPEAPPGTAPGGLTLLEGKNLSLDPKDSPFRYQYLDLRDGASLTISGSVVIYVTGPAIPGDSDGRVVSLGKNVTVGSDSPGAQLLIVTKSTGAPEDFARFEAKDGFKLYGSIYGTNTDVYVRSNSTIYGSIVARTILVGSGSKIHYDQAQSNLAVCTNGKYTLRRGTWREIIPN